MMYDRAASGDNSLPPGPTLSPKAQALRWIGQPYEFLRDCARSYGDAFTLDMGFEEGKYVILSHPEAVRRVVTAEVGMLKVCNAVLSPLLGPGSLLLLDGEVHLRERKLLMPAFQHRAIANYGKIIAETVSDATRDWCAGHEFVAQDVLQKMSLDVISRIIFGPGAKFRSHEFERALFTLLDDRRLGLGLMTRRGESGTIPALGSFWKAFDDVRDRALDLVARGRREATGGTMLSMLSEATDEKGTRYSDEELRDEVLTLLVTGHETTATALSWGLYWTARLEGVRERIRAELADYGSPGHGGPWSYLDATCKEILRIYPIVPALFRQVVRGPFAINDRVFDAGTFLSPSIYLLHHREDVYADPDEFEPSRFRKDFSSYEYMPFGAGARRCVGMHLANYEMKVVLASLLQSFDFEMAAGQRIGPARRFVTVGPGERLRLRVLKRIRPTTAYFPAASASIR